MNWANFFLFSLFASEDENEELRRENAALWAQLRQQEQQWEEYDDDPHDDDYNDEDQYWDDQAGE